MKKMIGRLMAMCLLAVSLAAFAQSGDNMKQDSMKHDDMKQDQMNNDQMKKDEMKRNKKSKKTKKDKSKILEFEWWDNDPGYVFLDPLDNTQQYMNEVEFQFYKRQLDEEFNERIEDYDRQIGRKWQHAFILNRRHFLEDPSDMAGQRFSFNPMCCHFDEFDRIFYGFTRVLMDPQRYANKFFNQMIEIMARQAKAGVMAEVSAFEDDAQRLDFQDRYAQVGSINFVAEGGIGKIKEKQLPEIPNASMTIMNFCIESMSQVTGISEASLGLGAATQAGIMLKKRQRAGMVLLAAEFDAESDFRKEEGMITVDYLKLIADDRLIRVGSNYDGKVKSLSNAPYSLIYEIDLDEVERDPNMRQWLADAIMGPFGQTLMRMGMFLPEYLNVLPIPRRWIEKLKQQMQAREQKAQEDAAKGLPPPGGRGQRKSLIELQALVDNKQADSLLKRAKAQAMLMKAGQEGQKLRQEDIKMVLESMRETEEQRRAQDEARRAQQMHGMEMMQGAVGMATDIHQTLNPPTPGAGR